MFDVDRVLALIRKLILLTLAGSGGSFAGALLWVVIAQPFERTPMGQTQLSIIPFVVAGASLAVLAEAFFDVTGSGTLWGVIGFLIVLGSVVFLV